MKPVNKKELILVSEETYQKLLTLIESLPSESRMANFTFDTQKLKEKHWQRDRNVRDVLIHLYEWQNLLLEWVNNNRMGQRSNFLPQGYNWRNYGEMNQVFWQKHQETSLKQALDLLAESHAQVMALLKTFSNDELFQKIIYHWTGNNTLGSYFIANTSSHYEWAIKKLRKYKRSLR